MELIPKKMQVGPKKSGSGT